MSTREPIEIDEWYHCYNRGVDKRVVFTDKYEYEYFCMLLYVCNGTNQIHASDYRSKNLEELLNRSNINTGEKLVSIGAYCLMPNHFHLLLREKSAGGISKFMQKLGTAYTMHFNLRHDRTGALFGGKFKSKHIVDDVYLKRAVAYIHLNHLDIIDPNWHLEKNTDPLKTLETKLQQYKYTSLNEFIERDNKKCVLLSPEIFEYYDAIPELKSMVDDAKMFKLKA